MTRHGDGRLWETRYSDDFANASHYYRTRAPLCDENLGLPPAEPTKKGRDTLPQRIAP
jgi:hypothetical protein